MRAVAIALATFAIAGCAGRASTPESAAGGAPEAALDAGSSEPAPVARPAPPARSPEEERQIAALVDRLNQWCEGAPDECDVHERPEAHPGRVASGETGGWITDVRERLRALGASVRWNHASLRYERAADEEGTEEGTTTGPKEPRRAAPRRCLPVVAADCGCVYSCAPGQRRPDGRWSVTHPHWGATPLTARVDRWCVDGQCTEAFFGDIVCSSICAPRPADSSCHFEGDRCVGSDAVPPR